MIASFSPQLDGLVSESLELRGDLSRSQMFSFPTTDASLDWTCLASFW